LGLPAVVARAGLPVADRHEQPDAAQLGGKVVRVVRGPDAGLPLRVAPQGVWGLVEVAQRGLDDLGGRSGAALVAGVQHPAVGGGRPEQARVARRVRHGPEPAHGQPGDDPAVTGVPVALEQLP
jgi:hypothetical protein